MRINEQSHFLFNESRLKLGVKISSKQIRQKHAIYDQLEQLKVPKLITSQQDIRRALDLTLSRMGYTGPSTAWGEGGGETISDHLVKQVQ